MILAGYPNGVQILSEHQAWIGILHPLQKLKTTQGCRSGIAPCGTHVAGLIWFDITGLGDKRQLTDIDPWKATVEALLALMSLTTWAQVI